MKNENKSIDGISAVKEIVYKKIEQGIQTKMVINRIHYEID